MTIDNFKVTSPKSLFEGVLQMTLKLYGTILLETSPNYLTNIEIYSLLEVVPTMVYTRLAH